MSPFAMLSLAYWCQLNGLLQWSSMSIAGLPSARGLQVLTTLVTSMTFNEFRG